MAWLRRGSSDPSPAGPPRERVLAALAEPLDPLVGPMSAIRPGQWWRPLTAEITALLSVTALKGAAFDVTYAVCCAWVPVAAGRALWPRTPAQASRHLWVDHFTLDAPERAWVTTTDGERALRRSAERAAAHARATAPSWWAMVATPAGVLAEAERQAGIGVDVHDPPARLVAAYTLARLGRGDAARAALEAAAPEDLDKHRAMLAEVLGRSRPTNH